MEVSNNEQKEHLGGHPTKGKRRERKEEGEGDFKPRRLPRFQTAFFALSHKLRGRIYEERMVTSTSTPGSMEMEV